MAYNDWAPPSWLEPKSGEYPWMLGTCYARSLAVAFSFVAVLTTGGTWEALAIGVVMESFKGMIERLRFKTGLT